MKIPTVINQAISPVQADPLSYQYYFGNELEFTYSKAMNTMFIGGKSCHDVLEIYRKVLIQVKDHLDDPVRQSFRLHFRYETFNSITTKYLFNIIKLLNKYPNKEIKVYWSYKRSKDMIDIGLDLLPFCKFPFEIIDL